MGIGLKQALMVVFNLLWAKDGDFGAVAFSVRVFIGSRIVRQVRMIHVHHAQRDAARPDPLKARNLAHAAAVGRTAGLRAITPADVLPITVRIIIVCEPIGAVLVDAGVDQGLPDRVHAGGICGPAVGGDVQGRQSGHVGVAF